MKNFVYGSNLCEQWLLDRVPSARYEFLARLPRHVLAFRKRSMDGSAKADIAFTGDQSDEVWGVVAHVPEEERHLLDAAEGLGNGYECRPVTVYHPEGRAHLVEAYVAEATHVDADYEPYDWYVALVLEGARAMGLPDEYIRRLESVPAVPDPNPHRDSRPPENRVC